MRIRYLSFFILTALVCSFASASAAGPLLVRQSLEDWNGARARTGGDDDWRKWLRRESERIEAWTAQEHDREDLVAGWIHDFQDEATGAFRTSQPDAGCSLPGAGERERAGCAALLRHRNIRMLQAAARLAVLTGSQPAAKWAAAQLDMYVRLRARQARPGLPVLFRRGLDEANAIPPLADAIRLLRAAGGTSPAERWCAELLLPMAKNLMAAQREVHNIAVWYSSAAAVAAMECADHELLTQALHGPWSLARLLADGISADGYWIELSLGYQNYVVQAVHEVLLAAALRDKGAALQPVHAAALSLLASPMRVQFSGGDGPTINDSNRYPAIPDSALLRQVRRTMPTETGMAAARAEQDWESLLDPPAPPGASPPLPAASPPGGAAISGLKSMQLRDGAWHAFLRTGQGARFHAHQDILSFELKHGDTWIFRHSATPAYGSALHRDYYKRAVAHNTPLVRGEGISNWFAQPAAQQVGDHRISAAFRSFQRGVGVQRQLLTDDGVFVDRLQFTAEGGADNLPGAIYHTDCTLAGTPPSSGAVALPASTGFAQLQPLASWHAEAGWVARLECGRQSYILRVAASAPFTVSQISAPALGPARRRTAMVVGIDTARSAQFELQLEPAPAVAVKGKR